MESLPVQINKSYEAKQGHFLSLPEASSDAHPAISCFKPEKSKHPKKGNKGVGREQLDLGELADIRLSSASKVLSDEALSSSEPIRTGNECFCRGIFYYGGCRVVVLEKIRDELPESEI